jgi:Ca2+-binding EF-hand superfamily protein
MRAMHIRLDDDELKAMF